METIGIQVVCAMRCGQLESFFCSDCPQAKQEERMCDGINSTGISKESVAYIDGVGEFYNCPVHCIPDSVHAFFKRHGIYEEYPNSVPMYEEMNPRYTEALRVYKSNIKKMSAPQEKPKKELHKSNVSRMNKLIVKK